MYKHRSRRLKIRLNYNEKRRYLRAKQIQKRHAHQHQPSQPNVSISPRQFANKFGKIRVL
ncbi:HNH endonuclease family protein [Emiliania huxleyi virus 18]|nr:HNH endonuclease family protein [Emiliania huxleyi virus 18]